MDTEYLTIKQLSQYTSLHINTLKSWMKKGMPFYRIGRSVRFKRSEFDEWVREFRAGGTTEERVGLSLDGILKEVRSR